MNFHKIPRKLGYVTEKHERVKTPYLLRIYRNHKIAEKEWPPSVFQTASVGLLTAGVAAAKRLRPVQLPLLIFPDIARNLCV